MIIRGRDLEIAKFNSKLIRKKKKGNKSSRDILEKVLLVAVQNEKSQEREVDESAQDGAARSNLFSPIIFEQWSTVDFTVVAFFL
jgi:hypothetical protein